MTVATDLNVLFYKKRPYDDIDLNERALDLRGWFSEPEIFDRAIDKLKPRLIIEVGSWKGLSAQYIIKRALQYGEASIICVDTWLGSPEHWMDPLLNEELNFRAGRPTLQDQFVANMKHLGLEEFVCPLALPSRLAAALLSYVRLNSNIFQADLIYIDGAHDEVSVEEDIEAYWPLLRSGGTMIGDDLSPTWPGVGRAVEAFRAKHADEIAVTGAVSSRWFAEKR